MILKIRIIKGENMGNFVVGMRVKSGSVCVAYSSQLDPNFR